MVTMPLNDGITYVNGIIDRIIDIYNPFEFKYHLFYLSLHANRVLSTISIFHNIEIHFANTIF